ncbi:MAG: flippase-like domain-containing protein, partial [Bacteroidaceae bacterium]|nr:flippase-like domain-containing protein [Bacteroidaceae bacterium]
MAQLIYLSLQDAKVLKKLKTLVNDTIKVILPLLLGAAILWWSYRNFDFSQVSDVLWHKMDWWWMGVSIPFGILAQMFRGWRWKQTLEPMGEHPTMKHCVNSIFVSYAANLVLP